MRKIAVVLGSGGAKGLAHIGVLRVLQSEGIPVDIVCGTSIGALMGAMFAAGVKMDGLAAMVQDMNLLDFVKIFSPSLSLRGLVDGTKVETLLKDIMGDLSFEDLQIPFAAVAVDINRGETVVFNSGSVIKAVRASISVPGIFVPCYNDGTYLVDGGLVNPVPVDVAVSMGAQQIVAVTLCTDVKKRTTYREAVRKHKAAGRHAAAQSLSNIRTRFYSALERLKAGLDIYDAPKVDPAPHFIKVLMNSIYIMESVITGAILRKYKLDVHITPAVDCVLASDFTKARMLIESGERAAQEAMHEIRQMLNCAAHKQ